MKNIFLSIIAVIFGVLLIRFVYGLSVQNIDFGSYIQLLLEDVPDVRSEWLHIVDLASNTPNMIDTFKQADNILDWLKLMYELAKNGFVVFYYFIRLIFVFLDSIISVITKIVCLLFDPYIITA